MNSALRNFSLCFLIFTLFLELNLSQNRMSALPEELSELSQLESVDISHNSFVSLPECLFSLPKVTEIKANNNFVAGKVYN